MPGPTTVKNAERILIASLRRYAVSRGLELQPLSGDWVACLAKANGSQDRTRQVEREQIGFAVSNRIETRKGKADHRGSADKHEDGPVTSSDDPYSDE